MASPARRRFPLAATGQTRYTVRAMIGLVRLLSPCLSLLLAGCGLVKYDLAMPPAKPGDKVLTESHIKMERFPLPPGSGLASLPAIDMTLVTLVETKEVKDGKPVAQQVEFQKATFVAELNSRGVKSGSAQLPIQGCTVLRRRAAQGWTSQFIRNPTPHPQQMAILNDLGDENLDIYPAGLVGMGESWTVPPEKVAQLYSGSAKTTGTMTCKLERSENLDGDRCAVIGVITEVRQVVGRAANGAQIISVRKLTGNIWRSLKDKIDVKMELSGTVAMEASGQYNGTNISALSAQTVPYSQTETRRIVR